MKDNRCLLKALYDELVLLDKKAFKPTTDPLPVLTIFKDLEERLIEIQQKLDSVKATFDKGGSNYTNLEVIKVHEGLTAIGKVLEIILKDNDGHC
ncbi:MAG: hypothetical protein OXH57_08150 [Ekhidna sp.]|nr:hypothetical protein [Ekhidna sp.]